MNSKQALIAEVLRIQSALAKGGHSNCQYWALIEAHREAVFKLRGYRPERCA